MLPLVYVNCQFAKVASKTSFFKENLKESRQVKELYQTSKLLLGLSADRVEINVGQDQRFYRFDFMNQDASKSIIGWMFYIPDQRRLDIYSSTDPNLPLIQAVGKKVVFKNYSIFLDRLGFDNLFKRLFSIL